jgi:FAD/FMN-containing dehydrogenase
MTKIIRHEPADLVATAEAGTTLSEFQKHLASAGQWLPIDPPDDGFATLGGLVATGLGGAQALGYGLPRSFVIGMRLVLADGRSIKAGGNVVKNVAGYDLCKLFCGSYGTLGLITELTFKLRPLPLETRTIVAAGSLASLLAAGRAVISGSLFPVAVELLSPRMAAHLKVAERQSDCALLVRFAGASRAVVSQTAQALKLARSDRDSQARTLDEDDVLWSNLAAVTLRLADNLSWRTSLRPSDLVSFVTEAALLETDEASHPSLMWHAGVGDGRLRAIAKPPVYHREAVRVLEHLRQRAESLGGNLVVESAPIEIKNEVDAWGGFGSATELMMRVKSELDPQNLLSPGRFQS